MLTESWDRSPSSWEFAADGTLYLEVEDEGAPRIFAYAAGDIEEVHRSAHSLKGSAGNIGARDLYAICRQLDDKAKASDHAGAGPFVAALAVEFSKVETAIHRLLATS